MTAPIIAYRKGYYAELKSGERALWCSCGRSQTQPYCDGAHAGTGFKPVPVRAKQAEAVIFCGCKHTKTPPFCDGTHSNLPGGYRTDDPDSAENRRVELVLPTGQPDVALDGRCYLFSTRRAVLTRRQSFAYCPVITPAKGAEFQSQFYAEQGPGRGPVIAADGRHTVLFVTEGAGEIAIGARRFALSARSGFYIRPSESYQLTNAGGDPIKLFISNGPATEDLRFEESLSETFEAAYPDRCCEIDPSQRHRMAERFFQMLVHRPQGSTLVTQFIGNIPLSKAEPHRHLYEEALIFLTDGGMVWTENRKAEVRAGDVLFLPRKQLHSVQCTVAGGIDVVGVIYPGDNPAINY